MNGKGSVQRKAAVSKEEFDRRWAETFGSGNDDGPREVSHRLEFGPYVCAGCGKAFSHFLQLANSFTDGGEVWHRKCWESRGGA